MLQAKKFQVYFGVVNYTIVLDERNKIHQLRIGEIEYWFRDFFGKNQIDRETLKRVFRLMLVEEPEKFEELYKLLKESDFEMFVYAEEVVHEVRDFSTTLMEK